MKLPQEERKDAGNQGKLQTETKGYDGDREPSISYHEYYDIVSMMRCRNHSNASSRLKLDLALVGKIA